MENRNFKDILFLPFLNECYYNQSCLIPNYLHLLCRKVPMNKWICLDYIPTTFKGICKNICKYFFSGKSFPVIREAGDWSSALSNQPERNVKRCILNLTDFNWTETAKLIATVWRCYLECFVTSSCSENVVCLDGVLTIQRHHLLCNVALCILKTMLNCFVSLFFLFTIFFVPF